MNKPKEILVPTDFSERSTEALAYAQVLGAPFEATIHVLHVVQDPRAEAWSRGHGDEPRRPPRDLASRRGAPIR